MCYKPFCSPRSRTQTLFISLKRVMFVECMPITGRFFFTCVFSFAYVTDLALTKLLSECWKGDGGPCDYFNVLSKQTHTVPAHRSPDAGHPFGKSHRFIGLRRDGDKRLTERSDRFPPSITCQSGYFTVCFFSVLTMHDVL